MKQNIGILSLEQISEVVRSTSFNYEKEIDDKLSLLKRERLEKPVIMISSGSCGRVAGSIEIFETVKEYVSNKEMDVDIIEVGSIGLCSSEPLMYIQLPGKARVAFEKLDESKAVDVLDATFNNVILREHALGQLKNENHESWEKIPFLQDLSFFARQKRVVLEHCGLIDPVNIEEYIAHGGYKGLIKCLYNYTPNQLTDLVFGSGLRGRGGGGFLTAEKWKTASSTESDVTYLICNADESDPGAFMDRAVLEGDPHKLIEGIAIAAYALRTSVAYVYIRSSYSLAVERLEEAIAQCIDKGILGNNILDSGFNLSIELKIGAGAFVCGEETALINSIEGKRGTPVSKPPYPAVSGLWGKPTVVNNVETLSNLPAIVHNGVEWYKAIGTDKSPGTKVFALSGKVNKVGLVEIPMGTTFKEIVVGVAGGVQDHKELKAVQIGGPSGSLITAKQMGTPVDFESLQEIDAIMGSGGLIVMDEETCIVDITKFFMEFLHQASCGKCIPCREGTRQMMEILTNIIDQRKSDAGYKTLNRFKGVMQLESLARVIESTSLCGLGKTAPKPLISALNEFREEFEEHIFDRKCRAGVCVGLRSYYIDVESCIGCTICAKKCPEGAIIGTAKSPHFIVEEKCTGCGMCFESCKFNAIHYN
jgi:NADH:ubiquinone oxidoreductase subunit F (NADH-binding)/Pyruvate/2-oxoacid:ferredoxin oxidoreductase delta subunit